MPQVKRQTTQYIPIYTSIHAIVISAGINVESIIDQPLTLLIRIRNKNGLMMKMRSAICNVSQHTPVLFQV
jgi:hypothetical protein